MGHDNKDTGNATDALLKENKSQYQSELSTGGFAKTGKLGGEGNYICPLDISFWKTGSAHGVSWGDANDDTKRGADFKISRGIIRGGTKKKDRAAECGIRGAG
jgi:hypothetical protein